MVFSTTGFINCIRIVTIHIQHLYEVFLPNRIHEHLHAAPMFNFGDNCISAPTTFINGLYAAFFSGRYTYQSHAGFALQNLVGVFDMPQLPTYRFVPSGLASSNVPARP